MIDKLSKHLTNMGGSWAAHFSGIISKYKSEYIQPYLKDTNKKRWLIGEKVTDDKKVSNNLYKLVSKIKNDVNIFLSVPVPSEFSSLILIIEKMFQSNKITSSLYSCIINKIEITKTYTESTTSSASIEYIHRTPNDGINPDYSGWQSDLYNEIYREYLDDNTNMVSSGLFADPSRDSDSLEHSLEGPGIVSVEDSKKSRVVINCCLNMNEPSNQMTDGGVFKFDEIALYSGSSSSVWAGYQLVNVGNDYHRENTGLLKNYEYVFDIMIDSDIKHIKILTPMVGTGENGAISYYDLLILLNNSFNDVGITVDLVNESFSSN
jgi:hypothetical protein